MTILIAKEERDQAIASIQRYSAEFMDEMLGNLAAGSLLEYILTEIGPLIYNQAVRDVQARLQTQIMEVDIEIHEEEFTYWRTRARSGRSR